MGTQLFQRAARVTVENLGGQTAFQTTFDPGNQIQGLRVKFEFKRTLRPEPSTAKIEIFNATKEHRAQMKDRNVPVILEAGYTDSIGLVFSGIARTIDHERRGTDWVSVAQCGDGETSFRFNRLSKSYGSGVGTLQVAKDLVQSLGAMTAGSQAVLASGLTDQFARGYTVHGPAARELSTLLAGRGLEWSFQHGKVQILPVGKPTTQTAVLLTPTTGLIGSPEHGTPSPNFEQDRSHTLIWTCFIQPTLVPGGLANIQSDSAKGLLRVIEINANGDTHGGGMDWVYKCEGNPTS